MKPTNYARKLVLLLSLGILASGFVPSTTTRRATTTTKAKFGLVPFDKASTKPLGERRVSTTERNMKDFTCDPDYTLTWQVAALCPLVIWFYDFYLGDGTLEQIGVGGGLFHLGFAYLLYIQTSRVRLVFSKDNFEFFNIKGKRFDPPVDAKLVQKPGNYVTGTINRWRYDKVTNWGFYPSFDFPVIVYFKETETPEKQWRKWFAAFDSYGRGQPHFFPGICNVAQFKEQMEARGAKRKRIPTFRNPSSS